MSDKKSSLHHGNIFDCSADVICHQVNCLGLMESGLAKEVKTRYPKVFTLYEQYCKNIPSKETFGTALVIPTDAAMTQFIANCFGQVGVARNEQSTDYNAVRAAFQAVVRFMRFNDLRTVAIPYGIGCGLGGGDWKIVRGIITDVFKDSGLYVEIWKLH